MINLCSDLLEELSLNDKRSFNDDVINYKKKKKFLVDRN